MTAPLAHLDERLQRQTAQLGPDFTGGLDGTSFAAPQVAGACALLFEQFGTEPVFGPVATWADLRQAILQATTRPQGLPSPEGAGWDPAAGHGVLDLDRLFTPPVPEVDLWIPKSKADIGTEPFVAARFTDSPALSLEDAEGTRLSPERVAAGEAMPTRLRVQVANRGKQPARDATVTVWWAPLGALHPLPDPQAGGGAWRAEEIGQPGDEPGNRQTIVMVEPGTTAEVVFDWAPPLDQEGRIHPHVLVATVGNQDDPFDPTDTACAQNNVAALCIAAAADGAASFTILGSDDTDGVILWCDNPDGRLRVEGLPVTALPWRDAAMFQRSGRRSRPLHGAPDAAEDCVLDLSARLEGEQAAAIPGITDALGAESLILRDGRVTIEAGARLMLPRLRIAAGAALYLRVSARDGGAIHMMHLSGGRRVGGGTVKVKGTQC
jgi:hypothetical protein